MRRKACLERVNEAISQREGIINDLNEVIKSDFVAKQSGSPQSLKSKALKALDALYIIRELLENKGELSLTAEDMLMHTVATKHGEHAQAVIRAEDYADNIIWVNKEIVLERNEELLNKLALRNNCQIVYKRKADGTLLNTVTLKQEEE